MAPSLEPVAELSTLPNSDGSATFTYAGYAVTAAVNGPIEAPRRDENPFEALVDVVVRPAAGVGGTAERLLENILQAALRQLIPVRNFPRCMIQVTLQIMQKPENAYENTKLVQASLDLLLIPALLHAAILGLMTAAVPLKSIAAATALAIPGNGLKENLIVEPTATQAEAASSVHVLAFTPHDELLLSESSGSFSVEEWEKILVAAQAICSQGSTSGSDTAMSGTALESPSMKDFFRAVMETKNTEDLHWK